MHLLGWSPLLAGAGGGDQPGGCSQAGSLSFAWSSLAILLSCPCSSFKALLTLWWSLLKLSTSMSEAPLNFERSAFLFFSLDSPVLPKLEADGRVVGDWGKAFHCPGYGFMSQRGCSCFLSWLGSCVGSELLDSQGFLMGEHLGLAPHGYRQTLELAGAHSWHWEEEPKWHPPLLSGSSPRDWPHWSMKLHPQGPVRLCACEVINT